MKRSSREHCLRPNTVWAAVNERCDNYRRVDDGAQRLSAFLFSTICFEEMRVCVARFLLRTCCSQASTEGLQGLSTNAQAERRTDSEGFVESHE